MASSQTQQHQAASPFKLLSRISWTKGSKKAKQASLGEENNMYYHPELKRWVEKGKEEEAEREAAGPPPPPTMSSGSLTSAPLSKRSLSQRYVLQPNLSISSSMASLAGSLSQTDLASLVGAGAGMGESFSGPPSALGSTAPSPPQSGNCLVPQGSYTSGPSSATGLGATTSFFVPPPPQRAASQPAGGSFFIPPPPTPEDGAVEDAAGEPVTDGSAKMLHQQQDQQGGLEDGEATGFFGSAAANGNGGVAAAMQKPELAAYSNGLPLPGCDSDTAETHACVATQDDGDAAVGDGDVNVAPPPADGPAPDAPSRPPESSVSFPAALTHYYQQVGSPVALSAANSTAGAPPLLAREYRRLGSAAANASDGGAAISLHEGMGVAPARSHAVAHHSGGVTAAVNGFASTAEEEAEVAVLGGGDAVGDASAAEGGEAAEPLVNGDAPAVAAGAASAVGEASSASDAAAVAAADGAASSSSTVYSQYYYQQYAYLYQYAVGQGYAEADAVSYAQYYAAVYAQQYEAQAPEGQLGGAEAASSSAAAAKEQQPQPVAGDGAEAAAGVVITAAEGTETTASAVAMVASESVGTSAEPDWQVAAVPVEEAAPAVVASGSVAPAEPAEVEDGGRGEDPVYVTARAPPAHIAPSLAAVDSAAPEAEAGPVTISAAPLPADLTAAATAAAHHHQSAVTAAVAAVAAAVEEQQQRAGGLLGADTAVSAALGAAAAADAFSGSAALSTASGGGLAPQLLLGLGAAGAKRLTQLSSAVTSLGATVAAAAPVAAALSAATAAAAAAGGFAGLETGLSEDDFERIMHPGDPAKLDGPLPWELPEHLRTGRKFLALCANWQLANPGKSYSPHLLLQQQEQQQQLLQPEGTKPLEVATGAGDAALAAEGGSGSAGGAVPVAAAAGQEQQEQQQLPGASPAAAEEQQLSSYERACRLSHFGQPAAALLPAKPSNTCAVAAAPPTPAAATHAAAPAVETELLPPRQQQQQPEEQLPQQPQTLLDSESSAPSNSEAMVAPLEAVQESAAAAESASPAGPSPLHRQVSESGCTPGEVSVEAQESGIASTEVEAEAEVGAADLPRLGTVEVADFFEHLGEQAKTLAAAKPEMTEEEDLAGPAMVASEEAATADVAAEVPDAGPVPSEDGAQAAAEEEEAEGAPAPAAATAAAAAIDCVVQALEQLRSSAAANAGSGDGDGLSAVADPAAGTALLLQIQSSLAQATEALAGMGVDVSALASLSGLSKLQDPGTPMEWTPGASHKRPRIEASPATPTRVAAAAGPTSGVVTPLLPPGPPPVRPVVEEPAAGGAALPAVAPGERFQQLGQRLSDACDEATAAAQGALPPMPQQSVVLSLTINPAPEVDVAAVEERVRCEERTAFEARLGAVVDSEREAAALVIAGVEAERDGLARRVEDLEAELAAASAERQERLQQLNAAVAELAQARATRSEAEAARDALAARLKEVTAERDALSAALTVERSEKAALAEALSAARCESEELRRRYAERFAALTSELEATRGSLAELQGEHDELLLCLGQESTKVEVLTGALREAGADPEPLIERIEAEYETMGLGGQGEGEAAEDEVAEGAEEGWEGEDLAL